MMRCDSFARRDVLPHVRVFSFALKIVGRAEAGPSELGSARASRAGDGALAIANFLPGAIAPGKACFGEGAKTRTRGACAPQRPAENAQR